MSSSSFNSSLPPPSIFSSTFHEQLQCLRSDAGLVNALAIMVAYVLVLLPVNVLVLYLSHRRRRRPSSATSVSHSDLFTVHTSIMELINTFGAVLICSGVYTDTPDLAMVGLLFSATNQIGVMLFHTLTCVERHLAVVHPITYLGLKKEKGIRTRNIMIGVVWLMSVGGCSSMCLSKQQFTVGALCILGLILTVVCFCSLSVLRVLVRPGPADGPGPRHQVDQAKLRAFHTITAILCVLLLKFGGNMCAVGMCLTHMVDRIQNCIIWTSLFWFSLPSNLALPLLFLLRAGEQCCCKTRQQSD